MPTLVSDAIEDYVALHSTPLPPLLEELVVATQQREGSRAEWIAGQSVCTLLQMLAATGGAHRVLEFGMFTGFSALMMAAALPEDGTLVTCEIEPERVAFAQSFFDRSPDGHKIDVRLGPALETLQTLQGPFDLVFIDADGENKITYYELALELLAPRGVIAVDNVLARGSVVDAQSERGRSTTAFNDHVQSDPRVTNVILTVRDGVMLIRRR